MAQILRSRRAAAGATLLLLAGVWAVISLVYPDQRQQVVTGLGTGAVIAGIALVVVFNHRGCGVVNFAAGAMAMYFAYVYLGLRTQGALMIPPLPNPLAPIEGIAHWAGSGVRLPHWPTMVSLNGGNPLSMPASLALTLADAGLTGLLVYVLVFRPLRHSSEMARAVASIGLFILSEAVVVLRFGDGQQSVPGILPAGSVHAAGVFAPASYFESAVIVVALALALWSFMRFTRHGLAMAAGAEREKAVVLLGYSPNVLAAANWVLASLISALIGILAAPITGLTPTGLAFLVVPALAAALLGGMSSFGIAAAAGIGLGVVQALIAFYSAQSWFPKYGQGLSAFPFPGLFPLFVLLVILVTLVLRSGALPARGATSQLRLPRSVTPQHFVPRTAVGTSIALVAMLTLPSAWRLGLINSVIGVVLALSVVILTGFVGQASVAQLSIAGVAGFVMAKVASDWGLAFPVGPLIGILCAVGFSFVCSVPALRIRGVNLAIVTLAIVEVVQNLVFQLATNGGSQGGANVGPPRFLGLKFGPLDSTTFRPLGDAVAGLLPNPFFGVFCIVVTTVMVLLTYWIRRSRTGLRFLAVRSDERAAATAGISVVRTKLLAFIVSAGVAGVAGMLSAYRFGTVTPDYFGDVQSLLFFAFAYLGGLGGVGGAIAAGFFAPSGIGTIMSSEWLHLPPEFFTLIGGIGLVLTVVTNPDGIAPKTVEASQKVWELARAHLGARGALLRRTAEDTAGARQAAPQGEGASARVLPERGAGGESVPVRSSPFEGPG